jgi:hypothetical protein
MTDEQVIGQLKERVAFLEGLVMSLVAKNEPRADSTTTQANTNPANHVQSAPPPNDKTSGERVTFLEGLVMSLVAKNQPSAEPAATQSNNNPANNVQSAPATIDQMPESEVSYLMRLPPVIRTDILERVLQPVFAAEPYGLIPALPVPVTRYTNKTRFPAVLHVNQIMRTESMRLYLGLAQTSMVDLESKNKELFNEHKTELDSTSGHNGPSYAPASPIYLSSVSPSEAARDNILRNFKSVTAMDSTCTFLRGTFESK